MADQGRRVVAAAIDGGVATLLLLFPYIGGVLAAAYLLVRDGLDVPFMSHQSLGKGLLGIRAVGRDGRPASLALSIQRNIPLVVGYLASTFAYFPIIGHHLALILGLSGAALGILEIVYVLTDPTRRRLGDKLADTYVVLASEPAGATS